jgi:hypothetical protein
MKVSGRLFPFFVTGSIECQILANFGSTAEPFVYEREEEREFEEVVSRLMS